jgi:uncharacterized membrane protein YbaN (DUF454 family)
MNNGGNMKWYHWIFAATLTWSFYVLGQPVPLPGGAGLGEIFVEVVKLFQDSKSLSYQYKIAATLFILVAIFKNSALQPQWEKLGKFKALVAPVLSLVAFLFMVQPFTVETAIAAITTGAAAGYFSQILDALKSIPTVGPFITFVSDIIGKIFKKPE